MALTRWHTLVAALWAGITCGFLYTFGTFGTALKDKFHLGTQTNTISTCQVVVGLVTFTAGLLVDWIGVGPTLILGCLINTGSWLIFGVIATGSSTTQGVVLIFSCLAGAATWGGACVTAAVFTTLAKNFKGQSSTPIGIAKAWVGVASGVATTTYVGFFPTSDKSEERLGYLWFLSAACFLGVALSAPLLRLIDEPVSDDRLWLPLHRRYQFLTGVTLVLIGVTASATLFHDSMSSTTKVVFSSAILAVVLVPCVLLIPRCGAADARAQSMENPGLLASPLSPASVARPASPWDGGPSVMLKRVDAYILWFVIWSLQSGGILLTINMASITQSRGGGTNDAAEATAAFSCAQSLGRLFAARISDVAVRRRTTRPMGFVILTATMCAGHAVLCLPGRAALFLGTILAGMAFGSMYPLMIVIIGELFGTSRIASNYMVFDGTPSAMASLVVGKYFATAVFNANIPAGSSTCVGDQCYRLTFVAVASLQLVAGVCALVLAIRSRIVYETCYWNEPLDAPATINNTAAVRNGERMQGTKVDRPIGLGRWRHRDTDNTAPQEGQPADADA